VGRSRQSAAGFCRKRGVPWRTPQVFVWRLSHAKAAKFGRVKLAIAGP
jgi:hypothetical protein